ncbi:hypothetical protein B0T16DRAFT_410904 [Cercophora newfieldiana]|uniref:N-acetyltransferase domain-containing protein n=1 Tax=Cercophora newfieldiana TaxID=92897 RepID=A0AA39YCS3_9PEZI|nr:hypothetical protein B0T16DRAFT_410904 [Cercophora newfieldiana]
MFKTCFLVAVVLLVDLHGLIQNKTHNSQQDRKMDHTSMLILPAVLEDVPVLATISSDAFETDSQTEMKSHGKKPFLMKEHTLESMPKQMESSRIRIIKAVEKDTGAIMGFCIWGFRGLEPPTTWEPEGDGSRHNPSPQGVELGDRAPTTRFLPDQQEAEHEGEKKELDDPIARLEQLTSQDLQEWSDAVMPPGASCLIVVGLSVSPDFQRRGVGSALLKWGTDIADRHHTYAWVHSSAGAWKAYQNAGFKVARVLDVDLDAFAPVPAPLERYPGGKWGHYVFRYMVYGVQPDVESGPS